MMANGTRLHGVKWSLGQQAQIKLCKHSFAFCLTRHTPAQQEQSWWQSCTYLLGYNHIGIPLQLDQSFSYVVCKSPLFSASGIYLSVILSSMQYVQFFCQIANLLAEVLMFFLSDELISCWHFLRSLSVSCFSSLPLILLADTLQPSQHTLHLSVFFTVFFRHKHFCVSFLTCSLCWATVSRSCLLSSSRLRSSLTFKLSLFLSWISSF